MKIRVLHIIGKMDRAGAETMLMNLYRHINREEIQFDFVTFTYDKGDYDEEILSLGGQIIPIIGQNAFIRMLKLFNFLKSNPEYQIIHAHTLLSNGFHLIAAKMAHIKYFISHAHNTSNGKYGFIARLYEKISIYLNTNYSDFRIACGREAGNYLFSNSSTVKILPNAVDLEKFNTISQNHSNYIQNNLEGKGLKIIQVGRLQEVKNYKFSLEVVEKLSKLNFSFTLYIIGKGPLLSYLEESVKSKQLSKYVKFLGVRTDIPELMAGADCMIMPSLNEGFPVVLVESQSIGLKSFVSDRIAKEVDLGLELVEFLNIDDIEPWVSSLKSYSKIESDSAIRKETLMHLGFDIRSNAEYLMNLYQSLSHK